PGAYQSAAVHHVAHAINDFLGNVGKTVTFVAPVHALDLKADQIQTVEKLIEEMKAEKVKVLLIVGGNPAYSIPEAMGFIEALGTYEVKNERGEVVKRVPYVPLRIHYGLFNDETSAHCHWHLPATHSLEQWSDARAFNGAVSIVQPLIAPLY